MQDQGNAVDSRHATRPTGTTAPHLRDLKQHLAENGLTLTEQRDGLFDARNPRGDLNQRIALRDHHGDGELFWCWAWDGPERDSPPEFEAMVPAGYEDEAARRITRVLYVHEAEQ